MKPSTRNLNATKRKRGAFFLKNSSIEDRVNLAVKFVSEDVIT
jgi:uncharacterized lipoprotein YajG